jgi:hypothetical protein
MTVLKACKDYRESKETLDPRACREFKAFRV